MKALVVDIAWCIGTFVVGTVVAYWLRQQGVEIPALPRSLMGT
jgi:hypothetical protein